MMENYDKTYWDDKKCPPVNCKKKQCECGLEKVFLSAALGDDSKDSPIAPKNGEYCNAIVIYEANGHIYIYTAEGVPVSIGIGEDGLDIIDKELATLQQEIDDLKNSPDVVDIVPTYAALQAYDTSKLGDNDIVRVLQDETHDGQSTYYRWNATTSSWTYIGAVGAYYTKDQIDALLSNKQNVLTAGSNITISGDTISATDTTYTAGTGLTLTDTTFAIDTDVVATKSDLPTVNDATLTINQNGVNKGTFTANDADNVTVNLTDTTYTAGNAIDITSNVISADIYPADYFTAGATVTGTGSSVTLNKTIPAKLKSVELNGDTTQQTYSGKNIEDFTTISFSSANSGSGTRDGGVYTINGNTNDGYGGIQFVQSDLQLEANTTYTFSAKVVSTTTVNGSKVYVTSAMSDDGGLSGNLAKAGEISQVTFTTPSSISSSASIRIYSSEKDTTTVFTDIQLEKGSTATSYEPYVGGVPAPNPDYPQDVNVVTGEQTVTVNGKNLASLQTSATKTVGGLSFTTDDGYIHINGTVSSTDNFYFDAFRTTSGSAVFSVEVTGYTNKPSSNCAIVLQSSPDGTSNWTSASTIWLTSTEPKSQSVILDNTKYYRIRILATDTSVFTNATIKPQLELGSTATPFQPYQSQSYTVDLGSTELCKIGNYQDYIYKSGDDWYIHKEIGKDVYTGSENITQQVTSIGGYRMPTSSKVKQSGAGVVLPMSDYFHSVPYSIYYNQSTRWYGMISAHDTTVTQQVYMSAPDDTHDSVVLFQSWLSTHNTTVYYVLETPTDTKITDTTLIGQLDALANANSYLDATSFIVTATGTNLPAILDVSAYRNSADGIAMRNPDVPTYSDFVGTDGVTAGTHGLVPAPATTDAGKFLKADGTWDTAGGGGPTVVQTTGTSQTDVMSQDATTKMVYSSKNPSTWASGGVIYLGNLDATQAQQPDPTTTAHPNWKYFWALPSSDSTVPSNNTINILGNDGLGGSHSSIILGNGTVIYGSQSIAIGNTAKADANGVSIGANAMAGNWSGKTGMTAIGYNANASFAEYSIHIGGNTGNSYGVRNADSTASIAIGKNSKVGGSTGYKNSVALGSYAEATRQGEVNVGLVTGETTGGYNSTAYRIIGGVHDGQLAHDAVTVDQINGLIDAINSATGSNISHIGA